MKQAVKMIIAATGLLASPVSAQQTAPTPPCQGEQFAQFDFWLGTWEVYDPSGKYAGENVIRKTERGCLITESWKGAGGSTGQSYNFYNPATEKWSQLWVSPGTIIDYEGGLTDTGSMKLEGTITYTGNGDVFPFRGEWTPNEDGTVTQFFEQFDPETDEWQGWFTGIYSKKTIKL